ncbi:MAG: hypothetical protein HN948_00800 [Clostridia bacterium]|nr:hypothetical protein [Clostridia bacterium]MBT7121527.1 hypothetical protein [Clostridia bacterium]
MAKNENCVVTDTSICKWIDKDCGECYIGGMKNEDDRKDALSNFEAMLNLLPDNFDDLSGDKCAFCKKDPRPRAGYALIDLGHKDPESKRGMFFGLGKKIRRRIGSLVPMNISVCKECRSALRWYEAIKWLSIAFFAAVAIMLLVVPGTGLGFDTSSSFIPYLIVIGGGVFGYFAGKFLAKQFIKAKSSQMYTNVFEIPVCADMQERGWFLVQENNGAVTRYIFSKKPMLRKIGDLKRLAGENDEEFSQTSFLED